MALAWRRWREHVLIYFLFLTFTAVTAIFWAHTSHRSYLDVYLIIFAASLLHRLFRRFISPFEESNGLPSHILRKTTLRSERT